MALRRLLGFYLASAQSAHRLAYEGSMIADNLVVAGSGRAFGTADEAVAWLIAEGDSLFAAINQAAASSRAAEQLLPAGDLLVAMEPLLESGTHTREFDHGHPRRAGRRHADRRPRPASCAPATCSAGCCSPATGCTEAEEQFRIVHELSAARAGEDRHRRGAERAGRRRRPAAPPHRGAGLVRRRPRSWYRENGVPAGEALVLSYSARDHLGLGHAEDAIAAAEKGLAIFTEIGSGAGTARARYHLGIVLSRVGRLTEAVHHHAECLAFFRASKQRVWEQRVCSRLAETFITAERYTDAVRHAEQALVVSQGDRPSVRRGALPHGAGQGAQRARQRHEEPRLPTAGLRHLHPARRPRGRGPQAPRWTALRSSSPEYSSSSRRVIHTWLIKAVPSGVRSPRRSVPSWNSARPAV